MKAKTIQGCSLALALTLVPVVGWAQPAPGWTFDNFRPKLQSADGRFSTGIRVRLHFDSAIFPEDDGGNTATSGFTAGSIVRRAFFGAEGRAFRKFWYEYRMDFGVGSGAADAKVNIARIHYDFLDPTRLDAPHLKLNAGIIQSAFTHEDDTSSASLIFLERSSPVMVATSAFGGGSPKRGAELVFQHIDMFHKGDNLVLAGSVTGWDSGVSEGAAQALQRVAYRLWSDGPSNIQIGASASELLDSKTGISLRDYPEIRAGAQRLADTGTISAQNGQMWGLDTEMTLQNFYLGGEFYHFRISPDLPIVAGNPEFSAWYAAASWILTGESRTYVPYATNKQTGTFNNPIVAHPLAPGQGNGWGAWELAARYSVLDLDWNPGLPGSTCLGVSAGCVRGGEQKIATFGLNWYLTNNFRMMFDYSMIDVDRLDRMGLDIGRRIHVIGTRLQFTN